MSEDGKKGRLARGGREVNYPGDKVGKLRVLEQRHQVVEAETTLKGCRFTSDMGERA